jgi:RNA polymerase-associated protein
VLLGAMLYRLEEMQIELPAHLIRPLLEYQKRIFERESFLSSIE